MVDLTTPSPQGKNKDKGEPHSVSTTGQVAGRKRARVPSVGDDSESGLSAGSGVGRGGAMPSAAAKAERPVATSSKKRKKKKKDKKGGRNRGGKQAKALGDSKQPAKRRRIAD